MNTEKIERLKKIRCEVEKDMQNRKGDLKYVYTTEDFFQWRDTVKKENGENSQKRNQIVEETIKGNQTFELLYDWTKCYRILVQTKAHANSQKEILLQSGMYQNKEFQALDRLHTMPLYRYLSKQEGIDIGNLFSMVKVANFGFRYNDFPSFHTDYEFFKMITHEEIYGPFAIDILVCLLRACNITGKDLIHCGRAVEEKERKLILDFYTKIPKTAIQK